MFHPADVEKEAGVFQSSASACVHGPGFIAKSLQYTYVVCEILSALVMQNYKDKIGEKVPNQDHVNHVAMKTWDITSRGG